MQYYLTVIGSCLIGLGSICCAEEPVSFNFSEAMDQGTEGATGTDPSENTKADSTNSDDAVAKDDSETDSNLDADALGSDTDALDSDTDILDSDTETITDNMAGDDTTSIVAVDGGIIVVPDKARCEHECISQESCRSVGGLIIDEMVCENKEQICCERVAEGVDCPAPLSCFENGSCLTEDSYPAYKCAGNNQTCCVVDSLRCEKQENASCESRLTTIMDCPDGEYYDNRYYCSNNQRCCVKTTESCAGSGGRCAIVGVEARARRGSLCSYDEVYSERYVCPLGFYCCMPEIDCAAGGGVCRGPLNMNGNYFNPCKADEIQHDVFSCLLEVQTCCVKKGSAILED